MQAGTNNAPVVVAFDVTVTGSSAATVVPVQTPSLPASYIYLALDKASVYPSGLAYDVAADASGFVTAVTAAAAADAVGAAHVALRAAGSHASWVLAPPGPGRLLDVAATYGAGAAQRAVPVSAETASVALGGGASLGAHFSYVLSRLISLGAAPAATQAALDGAAATQASLAAELSAAAATVFRSGGARNAILGVLLEADGPIFDTSPGSHVLAMVRGMRDIQLVLTVTTVAANVRYPGTLVTQGVTFGGVPLVLNLTDL